MMLIGGVLLAIAIEKCNLHRRLAIKMLLLIGTTPRWYVFKILTRDMMSNLVSLQGDLSHLNLYSHIQADTWFHVANMGFINVDK